MCGYVAACKICQQVFQLWCTPNAHVILAGFVPRDRCHKACECYLDRSCYAELRHRGAPKKMQ